MYRFARTFFPDESSFFTNIEYFDSYRTIGEIDAYGFIDGELYIIEYKTHYGKKQKKKALYQLHKAEKWVPPYGTVYHLLFVYEKNKYEEVISAKNGFD